TLSANLIFIDADDRGAQPSMLIPLSGSVTHIVLGTTDVASAQERRLSYYGPTIAVEHSNHAIRVSIGTAYFAIVDYVQKANEVPESRWEAVQYLPKFEANTVIYVASLDRALLAAASGDSQSAIEILEAAYDYAPSDLERARDRALLGVVCRTILI